MPGWTCCGNGGAWTWIVEPGTPFSGTVTCTAAPVAGSATERTWPGAAPGGIKTAIVRGRGAATAMAKELPGAAPAGTGTVIGNFLGNNETYTNYEFYEFMSPSNDDYPYVYDSLIHWPACDDAGEDITGSSSDNSAGYDDEINMQDDDERR